MYLTGTDTRRCLPRHVARAMERVLETPSPSVTPHDGWPDCVQIWRVLRDQLAITFTQVRGGANLHVRTCMLVFQYLANGWADYVQILCVTRDPLDKCFTHV